MIWRFNSTETIEAKILKKQKKTKEYLEKHGGYPYETVKKTGQAPRLSCGIRDCLLRSEGAEMLIKLWHKSDRNKNMEVGLGNLYLCGWDGKQNILCPGAVGFRNDNLKHYPTYIYNPNHVSLRRIKYGIALGQINLGKERTKIIPQRTIISITKTITLRNKIIKI